MADDGAASGGDKTTPPSKMDVSLGDSDRFFSPMPEQKVNRRRSDDAKPEALTKDDNPLVRSSSSPALASSKGTYDGCTTLADVTHLLFNKAPSAKKAVTALESSQPAPKEAPKALGEPTIAPPEAVQGPTPQEAKALGEPKPLHKPESSHEAQNQKRPTTRDQRPNKRPTNSTPAYNDNATKGLKRKAEQPAKRGRDAVAKMDKVGSTELVARKAGARKPTTSNNKHLRKTVSGPVRQSGTRDLLSRFITYNDQLSSNDHANLPPAPPRSTAASQYAQLPHQSPSPKRQNTQSTQRTSAEGNGIPEVCLIQGSGRQLSDLHSPESQRPSTGLLKNVSKRSPSRGEPSNWPRSVLPLVFDILRIFVIMFSTLCMVSRAFISLASKAGLLLMITNSPILIAVQVCISIFHNIFCTLELDLAVPIVLPRGSLDNWIQKGFLICFIGMLELLLSSNKSLDEIVDEVTGDELSGRSINVRVAFAVLGISARGTMAFGVLYMIFGVVGYSGETRRRVENRAGVGLAKTPSRDRASF